MTTTIRKIKEIIDPQYVMEGAGVRLRRSFGPSRENRFDPFLPAAPGPILGSTRGASAGYRMRTLSTSVRRTDPDDAKPGPETRQVEPRHIGDIAHRDHALAPQRTNRQRLVVELDPAVFVHGRFPISVGKGIGEVEARSLVVPYHTAVVGN